MIGKLDGSLLGCKHGELPGYKRMWRIGYEDDVSNVDTIGVVIRAMRMRQLRKKVFTPHTPMLKDRKNEMLSCWIFRFTS